MNNKGIILLTVVLSVLVAVAITLVYKHFGVSVMLACVIILLAVSNLITAIGHEKLSKKVQELEKKVEELTKK